MAALSDVILNCRLLVGDGPTDNLSRNESLDNDDIGNIINGANKVFSVINYPVVPSGFQTVQVDGTVLTSGYTPNEPIGELQFTAAPTQTVYATYYYYLMPDATWQTFILAALEILNLSSGQTNLANDLLAFPEGLLAALADLACSRWCIRIAAQTGLWYNQKLQERNEDRENISRKFLALSQEYQKKGLAEATSFYSGAGTQFKPSMRILEMTPRPVTPYR